ALLAFPESGVSDDDPAVLLDFLLLSSSFVLLVLVFVLLVTRYSHEFIHRFEIDDHLPRCRSVLPILHSSQVKHATRCRELPTVTILIREINDFTYSALYHKFRAFVARKERHVDSTTFQVLCVLVHYRVHFCKE